MASSSFVLSDPELQTDYHIFLDTSKVVSAAPVVLLMDGDDQYAAGVAAYRKLVSAKKVPPLNLVGVGYGGGYRSPKNRRIRDYTPTQPKEEPMPSGGAEQFHRFLAERFLPELYRRLGYEAESVGITGHSLGSLFGLYALAEPKPIFDRFLISSPSIWWDDRSVLPMLQKSSADTPPKALRAFLSVGEEDTPSMTGDLALLEKDLARHPRLDLTYVVKTSSQRDHHTAIDDGFYEGLGWLYA